MNNPKGASEVNSNSATKSTQRQHQRDGSMQPIQSAGLLAQRDALNKGAARTGMWPRCCAATLQQGPSMQSLVNACQATWCKCKQASKHACVVCAARPAHIVPGDACSQSWHQPACQPYKPQQQHTAGQQCRYKRKTGPSSLQHSKVLVNLLAASESPPIFNSTGWCFNYNCHRLPSLLQQLLAGWQRPLMATQTHHRQALYHNTRHCLATALQQPRCTCHMPGALVLATCYSQPASPPTF